MALTFSGGRAASVPVLVSGPPLERAAGSRSGIGSLMLDAALPLQGIVGDTMRREPRGQAPAQRSLDHGDTGSTAVLPRGEIPKRAAGGIPARGTNKRLAAVPGYGGFIEGKVAENLHGGTFRAENERTLLTLQAREVRRTMSDFGTPGRSTLSAPPHSSTSPESIMQMQWRHGSTRGLDGVGLNVAPHIPGTMTHVPGKVSESVHGLTATEASHQAQELRRYNPHVNCEGWLRKGQWPSDKRPTYRFLNRVVQTDTQNLFSRAEDMDFAEDNRRLAQTFGLHPPKSNIMKPSDRYLHSLAASRMGKQDEPRHIDASNMPPAGQPTHSPLLDGERWKLHNALVIKNGNQRAYD